MIELIEVSTEDLATDVSVTMDLGQRIKCRSRVQLDDGREAGIFLPRGNVLQHGDVLRSRCGLLVQVHAAAEKLSVCHCADPLLFARACYHLGNRHVQLQIGDSRLSYQHDHVLDDMLRGLGLLVSCEDAPFQPESGAYSGGHSHGDQHDHAH